MIIESHPIQIDVKSFPCSTFVFINTSSARLLLNYLCPSLGLDINKAASLGKDRDILTKDHVCLEIQGSRVQTQLRSMDFFGM